MLCLGGGRFDRRTFAAELLQFVHWACEVRIFGSGGGFETLCGLAYIHEAIPTGGALKLMRQHLELPAIIGLQGRIDGRDPLRQTGTEALDQFGRSWLGQQLLKDIVALRAG